MEKGRVRSLDSTICIKQCLIQQQLAWWVQRRNLLMLQHNISGNEDFFFFFGCFLLDTDNCSCEQFWDLWQGVISARKINSKYKIHSWNISQLLVNTGVLISQCYFQWNILMKHQGVWHLYKLCVKSTKKERNSVSDKNCWSLTHQSCDSLKV